VKGSAKWVKLAEEQGKIVRIIKEDMEADPASHTKEELDAAVAKLKELEAKEYQDRLASGYSAGVPGVVAAMGRMLKERGTFSLARATARAVARARQGFTMYEHLYDRIQQSAERLQHFEASVKLFLTADKKTPRVPVGQTFTNPDLADTLERLGREVCVCVCVCVYIYTAYV